MAPDRPPSRDPLACGCAPSCGARRAAAASGAEALEGSPSAPRVRAAAVEGAAETGTWALAALGVSGPLTRPPWLGPKPRLVPRVPTLGSLPLSDSGTSFLG